MPTTVFADAERGTVDDLVDVERYPINRPGSDEWEIVADAVADRLEAGGIVQLPRLLRPAALADLQDEMGRLRHYVDVTTEIRGAYGSVNTDLPASDPRRLPSTWVAGHITRDMIPPHSVAQRLFAAPGFKQFLARCLGTPQIFEYADPLAGLIATVLPPGGTYGWHYDTTEFVITLSITAGDRGGRFEYVTDLRQPGDENLAGLGEVLRGNRSLVRSVTAQPGDLQLFRGRYSLHRVTEVAGTSDRITLVLAYADRPGVIGPIERTRQVYGRVTEAHLVQQAATTGVDGLIR